MFLILFAMSNFRFGCTSINMLHGPRQKDSSLPTACITIQPFVLWGWRRRLRQGRGCRPSGLRKQYQIQYTHHTRVSCHLPCLWLDPSEKNTNSRKPQSNSNHAPGSMQTRASNMSASDSASGPCVSDQLLVPVLNCPDSQILGV